jgi:uncharacterized SAM-binding protein YcdF (DUF218 family)
MEHTEKIEPKDAILVLGGGIKKDGSLTDISKARVKRAVKVFKDKLAKNIIISGKWSFMLKEDPENTEAEAMRKIALRLGLSEDKIFLEEKSQDTIGNAFFSKQDIIDPNNWKDLIVITSDFHIRRTKFVFHLVFGEEYSIEFISVPNILKEKEFNKRLDFELRIINLLEEITREIIPGEDNSIYEFIYTKHPVYGKEPLISKKKYIEIIKQ